MSRYKVLIIVYLDVNIVLYGDDLLCGDKLNGITH